MSDRAAIRQVIERYVAGINSGDVDDIPLTGDVEFRGFTDTHQLFTGAR